MGDFCFASSAFRLLPTLAELRLVVDAVHEDDALVLALTCSPLRAAISLRGGPFARFPDGIKKKRVAMWSSVSRLQWARAAAIN